MQLFLLFGVLVVVTGAIIWWLRRRGSPAELKSKTKPQRAARGHKQRRRKAG